jgi:Ala-tRNA(Pro) deacylase
MNIQEYLSSRDASFHVEQHGSTSTACQIAEALDVPPRHVAKTVLIEADHGHTYFVAVLPATHQIDWNQLSLMLNGAEVELATPDEIATRCPDSTDGVVPPFGSQYDLKTIVDESLAKDEEIYFAGNSRDETIRMRYQDYYELEHPLVAPFAVREQDER